MGSSGTGAAFCALNDCGLVRVSGPDAAGFLQGQCTADVAALPSGGSGYGALCTPKGRVFACFRVLHFEESFYLLLPAEMAESVRKRLQIYVLRSKVTVEDLTAQYQMFGLLGTGIEFAAAECGIELPADPGGFPVSSEVLSLRFGENGERCWVAVAGATHQGFSEQLSGKLARVDSETWRLADIRAGIPEVVHATREEFLPQMLNLDLLGGIGFSKGCYTGQEIVARTHYLGQLKRRMFRLASATRGDIPAGAPVYEVSGTEPKAAGTVVAAAGTESGGKELLAVLGLERRESGQLRLLRTDGPEARLLPLPYALEFHDG